MGITQACSHKSRSDLPTMVLRTFVYNNLSTQSQDASHLAGYGASQHRNRKRQPCVVFCEQNHDGCLFLFLRCSGYYIIPMPPPMPPAGIAGASSLMSATTDSVVRNVEATDVAFCNAVLVTFTGSIIPASIIFTYSSL